MATISTVATNGASTLLESTQNPFFQIRSEKNKFKKKLIHLSLVGALMR